MEYVDQVCCARTVFAGGASQWDMARSLVLANQESYCMLIHSDRKTVVMEVGMCRGGCHNSLGPEMDRGLDACDRCSVFFRFTTQQGVHGRFDLMFLSSG